MYANEHVVDVFKAETFVEQVANYLREQISKGRWTGPMPGRNPLVKELGVNGSTLERALLQLEKEGLLVSQGQGRPRRICNDAEPAVPCTRVAIMLYEPVDAYHALIVDLQHQLSSMGHIVSFTSKSLMELKHNPMRVLATLEKSPADAYILLAAPRQVLSVTLQLPAPVFALFGRMSDLPMAGVGQHTKKAFREVIECLCENGHRRIVKLTRSENLEGELGKVERGFLNELENRGLSTGIYNLPHWENTPRGFQQCLDELFRVTPPTAIILDEWKLYYAAKNHLAGKRGKASRDAVCISMDYHDSFDWCQPSVPHFHADQSKYVKRTVEWVNNIARGKKDIRQTNIYASFVGGGSLAKAANS